MAFQFIDPHMYKKIEGWYSPNLGLDLPVVTYGHSGRPLLVFPTAAADFLENERFFLIKSIEPFIMAGRLRVFSIESINKHAWMNKHISVQEKGRRQALYQSYIEDELVPYMRHVVGNPHARIGVTGASFGCFHAANTIFRRPDMFDVLIGMSGFYDLGPDYFHGYGDDNTYFNNPMSYVPNLDGYFLDLLRNHCSINLVTGQGAYEAPGESIRFSDMLNSKGIPHNLDLWGSDVNHDWPWWRKMLPYYIERLGW